MGKSGRRRCELTNAASHGFESAGDAANAVVNGWRAVERDDHFIDILDDRAGVPGEEQSGGQQRNPDAEPPQHGA